MELESNDSYSESDAVVVEVVDGVAGGVAVLCVSRARRLGAAQGRFAFMSMVVRKALKLWPKILSGRTWVPSYDPFDSSVERCTPREAHS